jgi:hypothetical protein
MSKQNTHLRDFMNYYLWTYDGHQSNAVAQPSLLSRLTTLLYLQVKIG